MRRRPALLCSHSNKDVFFIPCGHTSLTAYTVDTELCFYSIVWFNETLEAPLGVSFVRFSLAHLKRALASLTKTLQLTV
jgi:hypothetical protein